MDTSHLIRPSERIGARAIVRPGTAHGRVVIGIERDDDGEFYDLQVGPKTDVWAVDVQPDLQHLLLLTHPAHSEADKRRFLCGHDERHWFVCGVPTTRGVSSVRTAMEALKPQPVRAAQDSLRIRGRDRIKRRTAAYTRQGEWFFLPAPEIQVPIHLTRRDEPLQRGPGSKPHIAQFAFRRGGEQVFVKSGFGRVLTMKEWRQESRKMTDQERGKWRQMMRNPELYIRGTVRHSDHDTITLGCWHRVHMNTENEAPGRGDLTFLD